MSPRSKTKFHSALAPLLEAYLDFKLKMGYTSFARPYLAQDLDDYLAFFSIPNIRKLDESVIYHWVHAIPQNSVATKNRKLIFARRFFDYLVRLGVVAHNPALRIPLLKRVAYRPYIYSLKEIHLILQDAAKHKGPLGQTLPTLFLLIYACGLRFGEALHLKIRDVNFEENTLSLWNTKFHKERLVPFSQEVSLKLSAYLAFRLQTFPTTDPHVPFFFYRNGPLRQTTVRTIFQQILRRGGIAKSKGRGGPRIHDLRHTFAVHRLYKWYQEGHDILNKLPILSTYMGHVSVENTQVYLTVTQALLREGDRRFQKTFEDLAHKPLQRVFKSL